MSYNYGDYSSLPPLSSERQSCFSAADEFNKIASRLQFVLQQARGVAHQEFSKQRTDMRTKCLPTIEHSHKGRSWSQFFGGLGGGLTKIASGFAPKGLKEVLEGASQFAPSISGVAQQHYEIQALEPDFNKQLFIGGYQEAKSSRTLTELVDSINRTGQKLFDMASQAGRSAITGG